MLTSTPSNTIDIVLHRSAINLSQYRLWDTEQLENYTLSWAV